MAEYLSPGVYVEEYDNAPRGMESVGTSTAGFVGIAEKGSVKGSISRFCPMAAEIRKLKNRCGNGAPFL